MRSLALFLILAAAPALAQSPLSAAEFEAYTAGKTLTYAANGQTYGIEEYLDGRRVRWSYLDGECKDGVWYPVNEMICFAYDTLEEEQCWTFFREPSGLRAVFMNDPETTALYETRQSPDPMLCLGPKIGV